MKKRNGFTLIELLTAIVIGFIVILLVYQTMQTSIMVSTDIRERLSQMQRMNFFLTSFSARLACMNPDSSENSFDSSSISIEIVEYKRRKIITYNAEENEYGKYTLFVEEKDPLYNTQSRYPAIENLDFFEFSFFDGDSWVPNWDKDTVPEGVSITIKRGNSEIFFPVTIDIKSLEIQQ
ncbi:MAG TPA: prepilin-type N-terminal cleavage/methylation domain-containing protein [bacterium]|nr:prepilin-type N-terminal cleavage/methylation domain-containing protein [bacterium]